MVSKIHRRLGHLQIQTGYTAEFLKAWKKYVPHKTVKCHPTQYISYCRLHLIVLFPRLSVILTLTYSRTRHSHIETKIFHPGKQSKPSANANPRTSSGAENHLYSASRLNNGPLPSPIMKRRMDLAPRKRKKGVSMERATAAGKKAGETPRASDYATLELMRMSSSMMVRMTCR